MPHASNSSFQKRRKSIHDLYKDGSFLNSRMIKVLTQVGSTLLRKPSAEHLPVSSPPYASRRLCVHECLRERKPLFLNLAPFQIFPALCLRFSNAKHTGAPSNPTRWAENRSLSRGWGEEGNHQNTTAAFKRDVSYSQHLPL